MRRSSSTWVPRLTDYNLQKVRFIDAKDVAAIHEARAAGKSYTALVEQFNCCRFTIGRVLNYEGYYRQFRSHD